MGYAKSFWEDRLALLLLSTIRRRIKIVTMQTTKCPTLLLPPFCLSWTCESQDIPQTITLQTLGKSFISSVVDLAPMVAQNNLETLSLRPSCAVRWHSLSLKSQVPWEVLKRKEDFFWGVRATSGVLHPQIPQSAQKLLLEKLMSCFYLDSSYNQTWNTFLCQWLILPEHTRMLKFSGAPGTGSDCACTSGSPWTPWNFKERSSKIPKSPFSGYILQTTIQVEKSQSERMQSQMFLNSTEMEFMFNRLCSSSTLSNQQNVQCISQSLTIEFYCRQLIGEHSEWVITVGLWLDGVTAMSLQVLGIVLTWNPAVSREGFFASIFN